MAAASHPAHSASKKPARTKQASMAIPMMRRSMVFISGHTANAATSACATSFWLTRSPSSERRRLACGEQSSVRTMSRSVARPRSCSGVPARSLMGLVRVFIRVVNTLRLGSCQPGCLGGAACGHVSPHVVSPVGGAARSPAGGYGGGSGWIGLSPHSHAGGSRAVCAAFLGRFRRVFGRVRLASVVHGRTLIRYAGDDKSSRARQGGSRLKRFILRRVALAPPWRRFGGEHVGDGYARREARKADDANI